MADREMGGGRSHSLAAGMLAKAYATLEECVCTLLDYLLSFALGLHAG